MVRLPRLKSRMKTHKLALSAEVKGWLLCSPALAIFLVFFLGPALVGIIVSLREWDGLSSTMQFVGLDNYVRLFSTERFWKTMRVNWLVVIGSLLMQIPLALALALALSKKTFGMRLYRNAIFVPQVLSIAAVVVTWTLIFDPYQGLINGLISRVTVGLGLGSFRVGWLGETKTALGSALVAANWYYFGLTMILFMAGLASIPSEYYDAAKIETNQWYDVLRYVTLPMLREVLLIVFALNVSGSFGHLIGLFFLLTSGGPAGRTELLGLYMHSSAFRAFRFGYASAISVVMVVIVLLVVLWPALRIARERLEY